MNSGKQTGDRSPSPRVQAVVGVGASAGGLAALKSFFERFPTDTRLAFVVVVHLSPERESHLAQLLQPHVAFPVEQLSETVRIEPGRVYVIPPARNVTAVDTHLRLSEIEVERGERAPIDHFLGTLASTHDGHAIAVILTGTGADGARGIREVKAMGGLVIVQDPDEAEYDSMPRNSISTGVVDHVLPLDEMAGAILRFAKTRPRIRLPEEGDLSAPETRLLQEIFALLRAQTNRDFSRYKRSSVLRRVARRMQMHSIEEASEYVKRLQAEPAEVQSLAEDLLITVTNYFRDPEVYEKLENTILPKILEGKGSLDTIRVWTVGCATGEEAYSLALLLVEAVQLREEAPRIQIFASDLHKTALDRARRGFFSEEIEADVSPERLKRFFRKESGGYRIVREIRDLVVFTPHNLLSDPPFSRLNLITCRNLLIYLQRHVQRDVIDIFHYALSPGGYLLLGSSETIDTSDLFQAEDEALCIYRRRNVQPPEPRLPVFPLTLGRLPNRTPQAADGSAPVAYGALHARMLDRYAPPSILVSADNKVVHLSERAGRYLVQPGGELTASVFALVRPELRIELRTLLQIVRGGSVPASSQPIAVRFDGAPVRVVIHAHPPVERDHDGFALVVFEDGDPSGESTPPPGRSDDDGERSADLRRLESELDTTRQQLQVIIEDFETGQEEMRASNEELQSANEELRSTMEELETSKEELQSMNEELQTVNQENRHKVEELSQITGDLQNLLAATDIATLFLDRKLRILRFTPKVGLLFNVRMADLGRPVSDLTHCLGYPDLLDDARRVIADLAPVEKEVRDKNDGWYLTRILPYRSTDDRIEGVVITFVEITRRVTAEAALRESEQLSRLLVERAREYAIVLLDTQGCIRTWNSGARRLFAYLEEEVTGKPHAVIYTPEDQSAGIPEAELESATVDGSISDDRWYVRKDGVRLWASGVTQQLRDEEGVLKGYFKVLRDNTERKRMEETLRKWNESLEERVRERTSALGEREREIRALGLQLAMAEANERDRIALVLHDDLQQRLYSMQVIIALMRRSVEAREMDEVGKLTTELGTRLSETVQSVSGLASDLSLHCSEAATLAEAVRQLAERMQANHRLEVDVTSATTIPEPSLEVRTVLLQGLQELLFNVVKHSGASRAGIDLAQDGSALVVRVRDQGDGFDPSAGSRPRGLGLPRVQHQVSLMHGEVEIDSTAGEGTTITVRIPTSPEDPLRRGLSP